MPSGRRLVGSGAPAWSAALAAAVLAVATFPGPAGGGLAARSGTVPASLDAVESGAEDVIDAAFAGDRTTVVADARGLATASHGVVKADLKKAGVPDATVHLLGLRADGVARLAPRGRFVDVMLAANAVSALMPDLFGRFRPRTPPLLLALDYLDREAELRSLAGQPRPSTRAVQELGRTWPKVRPRVVSAGGRTEAAAFDRHVAAMKRLVAAGGSALRAEAARGLELVDSLERVFR